MKKTLSALLCLCLLLGLIPITKIYAAEQSQAPLKSDVTITNNVKQKDSIYISGLAQGDLVTIYNAPTGGKTLASKKVGSGQTDVTITLSQLGTNAGSIYISVTTPKMAQSTRTKCDFSAEPISAPPVDSQVVITNNTDKNDTILVSGLMPKDVVTVYNAATGGRVLKSGSVPANKEEVTITVSQLSSKSGTVYISITSQNMLESSRTAVSYSSEGITPPLSADTIEVTNNVSGSKDTIYIYDLYPGDIVNVYDSMVGGRNLGKASCANNKSEVTISTAQLGKGEGTIYISLKRSGMMESERVAIDYDAEDVTPSVIGDDVIITNNSGASDTIYISDLQPGDVIKVYTSESKSTLWGQGAVPQGKDNVTVSITQLGSNAGTVWITNTRKGMRESSSRTQVEYSSEKISNGISSSNVIVKNNVGAVDTILFIDIPEGSTVYAYRGATGADLLGSATIASGSTTATISTSQLGTSAGNIYVTIKSPNSKESGRIAVPYSSEMQSGMLNSNQIVVTNNVVGNADTVQVVNLIAGDVIKVYDKPLAGTVLGSSTVSSGSSSVNISIPQLGTTSGSVYVTVKSLNKSESDVTIADYSSESESGRADAGNITVNNNVGTVDTVIVTGLYEGDVVKVYIKAIAGSLLGSATVEKGNSYATVSISQLGTSAGTVYISITNSNSLEGERIAKNYSQEGQSSVLSASNVVVTNNVVGTSDTIQIVGLAENDTVKVYKEDGSLLSKATVASGSTNVTISVSQLGSAAGRLYVTVTKLNNAESSKTEVSYAAEVASGQIIDSNVIITNNAFKADTIVVKGLKAGDIIKVYDNPVAGNILGSGTVASSSTSVTISIDQLGESAGKVYLSLTSSKQLEGDRVEARYESEGKSAKIDVANVTITNNANTEDIVYVTGLSYNDMVKVYRNSDGSELLGSLKISTYGTSATIKISQLGEVSGTVYLSLTQENKSESDFTSVSYSAETKSNIVNAENVIVTNNSGLADTVYITKLSVGDVVTIYDSAACSNPIGSATIAGGSTNATISIGQLGSGAGSIWVTLRTANKAESNAVQIGYSAELKSDSVKEENVSVANNSGIASTLTAIKLEGGATVKVYDRATAGTLLGTGTVSTYGSEVIITLSSLNTEGGTVYVTTTSTGKLESDGTPVSYSSKKTTNAPSESSIEIVNNAGITDTVTVTGLNVGDIIKVYSGALGDSNSELLGSATVESGNLEATVTISQIGKNGGVIYVSLTGIGKVESERTFVEFLAETQSKAPSLGNISILNNATGTSDEVIVTGLLVNDTVKVYNASTGGSALGSAVVKAGTSSATIYIPQLGTSGGSIYVSVKSNGKIESERTEAVYEAESIAPSLSSITVTNNAGLADSITVTNLSANDVVKVYNSTTNGSLIGSANVPSGSSTVTISIPQLMSTGGYVFVTVTSFGKFESAFTKVEYLAEQSTNPLYSGYVTIANNASEVSDKITVSNLSPNDIVKVYDSQENGSLLGSATVSSNGNSVDITIKQLGVSAGSVYISVTNIGKIESSRVKIDYIAEID